MFVPEARNDPTSSKTLVLGSVQDSGTPLLSAQAGGYVFGAGAQFLMNTDDLLA